MASKLELRGVSVTYPGGTAALRDVDLAVEEGEWVCLIGPSGCGKTTLLRVMAGLLAASSGSVVRQPVDVGRRFSGMVFQDLALFPWKTVYENIALGLELKGLPAGEVGEIVSSHIRRMHLTGFERHYPRHLSGGMRQRVALARVLASDPEVLLMDEPLGSLDASTRRLLQEEILSVWEGRRKTMVFVTHSIEEALLLGNRVILMSRRPGRPREEIAVPFPRPRTRALCATPAFARLTEQIWERLESEVRAGLEEPASGAEGSGA